MSKIQSLARQVSARLYGVRVGVQRNHSMRGELLAANQITQRWASTGGQPDYTTHFQQKQQQERQQMYQGGFQPPTPGPIRRNFRGKYVFIGIIVTAAAGIVYFFNKHTFPRPVARILRKGLWEEMGRAENKDGKIVRNPNPREALKFYIQALEKADELGMEKSSDEYTGIQLKIAEMYEKLNMIREAEGIYGELWLLYLTLLNEHKDDPSDRPRYVQRGLRVALKMISMRELIPSVGKAILTPYLIEAEREVRRRQGLPITVITDKPVAGAVPLTADGSPVTVMDQDNYKTNERVDSETILKNPLISNAAKATTAWVKEYIMPFDNSDAWEPFKDELFNARDLFVALCVGAGDISLAVRTKLTTIEWMVIARSPPGELLMSQANLASLIYLEAEQFEAREYMAKKTQQPAEEFIKNKEECLASAEACYQAVLKFGKQVPASYQASDPTIGEAVGLATYGLGVIRLHTGKLDEAFEYLRQAKLRARGGGYKDLSHECDMELAKVKKEKEKAKAQVKGSSVTSKETKAPDTQVSGQTSGAAEQRNA